MGSVGRRQLHAPQRLPRRSEVRTWAERNAAALTWCPGVGAVVPRVDGQVRCEHCGRRLSVVGTQERAAVRRHKYRRDG